MILFLQKCDKNNDFHQILCNYSSFTNKSEEHTVVKKKIFIVKWECKPCPRVMCMLNSFI